MKKVLVIGSTGSIGRKVVTEALGHGLVVKALARNAAQAAEILPEGAELIIGDATDEDVLRHALADVDGVILTHSGHAPEEAIISVDYGVVKKLLSLIQNKDTHIVLMTSFGVTAPEQPHNQELHILDWKRRSERLVRLSGHPYTIVRPGWFDYNDASERSIVFLQGDPLRSGTPEAGRIARDQIARVLVESLMLSGAVRKTFELIAEKGNEQDDLSELFNRLLPDISGLSEGVLDPNTLPLEDEPQDVLADLYAVAGI